MENNIDKKFRTELHHNWPVVLSNFWCDDSGQVNRLSARGELLRSPPKNFGAIKDGHRIKFSDGNEPSFWDHSIESLFDVADSNMRYVVEYLLGLESIISNDKNTLNSRFIGVNIENEMRASIGESIASLIVRSPAFRYKMKLSAEYFRDGLPYINSVSENNLIVANLGREFDGIVRSLREGGKLVVLFSDSQEFIYGEGFLNNISGGLINNQKYLVPLTPTIAIAFTRPSTYCTMPNAITIRLSSAEVEVCNEISQVYTNNYIYYRSMEPIISSNFSVNEFREYKYHENYWLDNLLNAAAKFR